MEENNLMLDGSLESGIRNIKKLLGLREDQTFQDLDIDISDMEDEEE